MTLDPKIYRRAAEILAPRFFIVNGDPNYACDAIWQMDYKNRHANKALFADYFCPPESHITTIWYGSVEAENQLARQLALLFMEQIAMDLMKERRGQR